MIYIDKKILENIFLRKVKNLILESSTRQKPFIDPFINHNRRDSETLVLQLEVFPGQLLVLSVQVKLWVSLRSHLFQLQNQFVPLLEDVSWIKCVAESVFAP